MRDDSLVVSTGESLIRLTPGGRLDGFFGQGGTLTPPAAPGDRFEIRGLAVDSRGRLVVAGTSVDPEGGTFGNNSPPGFQAVRVLRYLPTGVLDPGFGEGGIVETDFGLPAPHDESVQVHFDRPWVEASGVAVDSQDRVLLTGGAAAGVRVSCAHDWFFSTLTYAGFVARLTEAGAPDSSFSGDGVFGGRSVMENPLRAEVSASPVIGPDDEVVYRVGLRHCPRNGISSGLAKLNADGEPPPSFVSEGAFRQWRGAIAIDPGGGIVTIGYASPWDPTVEPARMRITRLGSDGRRDLSYGRRGQTALTAPGGAGSRLVSLAVDSRGRALLGGTMIAIKTLSGRAPGPRKRYRRAFVLVRLKARGGVDQAFGPHGRVVAKFGRLKVTEARLLLDSHGRAVMFGTYRTSEGRGLAIARYTIDR